MCIVDKLSFANCTHTTYFPLFPCKHGFSTSCNTSAHIIRKYLSSPDSSNCRHCYQETLLSIRTEYASKYLDLEREARSLGWSSTDIQGSLMEMQAEMDTAVAEWKTTCGRSEGENEEVKLGAFAESIRFQFGPKPVTEPFLFNAGMDKVFMDPFLAKKAARQAKAKKMTRVKVLKAERVTIRDIQLWSSSTLPRSPIGRNAKLHFLSIIHVPSIPLYLVASPSLDVTTDDESTAMWLRQSLLAGSGQDGQGDTSVGPWWASLGKQSEQGILLKVEEEGPYPDAWKVITELLLYAAAKWDHTALPTPPGSSSPAHAGEDLSTYGGERPQEVNVYALPLASNIISQAGNEMLVIPPSPEEIVPACFLPDCSENSKDSQKTQEKRPSLASLFEDATQKRRKLKGQGGERVAQAMASLDRPASQHGAVAETRNESQRQSHMPAQGTTARKGLSRASTMSSIPGPEYARPVSSSRLLANGKRSSLHRVESAISPRDSPTLSDTDESFGTRNRAALCKIVMAGMRLYGLQQKKKTGGATASQAPSTAVAPEDAPLAEKEGNDAYKLVYHQTFKAATFAFRRQISSQVIPLEAMRDIVDRFLNLFCTNPIASTGLPNDGVYGALEFSTRGSEGSGAFDLPSVKTVALTALTT